MAKNIKKLSGETETLNKKNKQLQQQLREAMETIAQIRNGYIDALVVSNKKDLKVYTEKTADKTYRILIEKMHEGAVTLNDDKTILYCNSSFAKMVNLPLQKVIGAQFINFIQDTSKKHVEALLKRGRKQDIKAEVYFITNDDKAIPALISINTLSLDDKIVQSVIVTDLTIQNKNKQQLNHRTRQLLDKNAELENANKDLTSFTHISSHDLQEPLRKIQNFVSCLLDEEKENLSEKGKNHLQRTYETAKRMRSLINDLLAYAGTSNDHHKFEKIDLNLVLDQVKKDLKEDLLEKKAVIKASGLGKVNVIPFQFRQLMDNIICNALKFSKPQIQPRIEIKSKIIPGDKLKINSLSTKLNYCQISFIDNGIGFNPEYKDRIFEVFQRLHSQSEYGGTGIGLAICKKIAENHKGVITATGKLDEGARFDIYIPV